MHKKSFRQNMSWLRRYDRHIFRGPYFPKSEASRQRILRRFRKTSGIYQRTIKKNARNRRIAEHAVDLYLKIKLTGIVCLVLPIQPDDSIVLDIASFPR